MSTPAMDAGARARLVQSVVPIVKAILARKSGMSLADNDMRAENVEAIELQQDVIARLWERLTDDAADAESIRDFRAYAAMITYNAWSDHLRGRYPERTSLKNALRYFMSHQAAFAVWNATSGETLCGMKSWQLAGTAPAREASSLVSGQTRLPPGSVPRKDRDRFVAADWDRLLRAVFDLAHGPLEIDDLVTIVARAIGLKEPTRVEHDPADDEADPVDAVPAEGLTPAELAELRSQLAVLWQLIAALRRDHRQPYVLNPPAADGGRGEIEVFVVNGVARIADVAAAADLATEQYVRLWPLIELAPEDRDELADLTTPLEQFALLFKYLPLADGVIGDLMGLAAQQVINRRNTALRTLRQALTERLQSARSAQARRSP